MSFENLRKSLNVGLLAMGAMSVMFNNFIIG